jgi:hypothetical protein
VGYSTSLESYQEAVAAAYPDVPFISAKFEKPSSWANPSSLVPFFNRLAHNKGFHPSSDVHEWYKVKWKEVERYQGGSRILHTYKGHGRAIIAAYPKIVFNELKFNVYTNTGKEKGPKSIAQFFNKLGHEKNFHPVREYTRWYDIKKRDITRYRGGNWIIAEYNGIKKALKIAYPSIEFDKSLFGPTPTETKRTFFNYLAHNMGFHATLDFTMWNDISIDDVKHFDGSLKMIHPYDTLQKAFRQVYPKLYVNNSMRDECVLQDTVKDLFPNLFVEFNKRAGSGLIHVTEKGRKIHKEIDVFIPSLNLGFEYQDYYHYTTTWFASLKAQQERDRQKEEMMKKLGRNLIVVPCWWDKTKESLAATIRVQRPELLLPYARNESKPIATVPPPGFFSSPNIPDVGELMQACFGGPSNLAYDWWMGEKYDGIRTFWNPKSMLLYSRQGRSISLLEIFYLLLPCCFIDGELWFGRQNFLHAAQIGKVKHKADPELKIGWMFARFIAFDSPSSTNSTEKYEKRFLRMMTGVLRNHPFLGLCTRVLCCSKNHMEHYVRIIINNGGEGIMLRLPGSLYEHGKSQSLLKLKNMIDAEAVVVDIKANNHICKLPNGDLITTVKKTAKMAVKIGDIVSFEVLNKKLLRKHLHQITRVRSDLLWDDVLRSYFGGKAG